MRGAQRILWAIGFTILGYCGMAFVNARLQQMRGNRELDRLLETKSRTIQPKYGGLVGRVEIPRLHLSAVVFEGTDDPILSMGVGHLTGSALPGQNGNVVLAGHRDSFFRALRNIKGGDEVDVTTEYGTRAYRVKTTEIVDPAKVSVLEPTRSPTLTLVTCYPFYFVGHAPKRFIVQGLEAQASPVPLVPAKVTPGQPTPTQAPASPFLKETRRRVVTHRRSFRNWAPFG